MLKELQNVRDKNCWAPHSNFSDVREMCWGLQNKLELLTPTYHIFDKMLEKSWLFTMTLNFLNSWGQRDIQGDENDYWEKNKWGLP